MHTRGGRGTATAMAVVEILRAVLVGVKATVAVVVEVTEEAEVAEMKVGMVTDAGFEVEEQEE